MKIFLRDIHHDKKGFQTLLDFYRNTKDCLFDSIEIDMSRTSWFDADMCAMFGALLYRLGDSQNNVKLTQTTPKVEAILSKNGFLSHYGHNRVPDRYGTTISYERFDVDDDRYFSRYIENELIQHSEIPEMSRGLSKKFRESIFEIFSNAVLHSHTELGVFSCGQFFPNKEKLDFMVVDLGIGFRKNIEQRKSLNLAADEAIEWATQGNNTTKSGKVPGGQGLKLLSEFIDLNDGCVQIVSDAGYWKRAKRRIETAIFSHSFPGTVVSLEINTADTNSYLLKSELTERDIF